MKSSSTLSFWKIIFIALLLISIRFYPAILEGKVTVFGDNYSLQVPGKIFTAYWLKQGIIPWWNPTIFAGIPWGHEISQSLFYPTTLLFMYLDPGPALNWSIALHLLFTFIGMFVLTKKWVKNDMASLFGAILWTFSTQVTGSSNNLVTIQAICWFPWVAYWSLRLFESIKNPLIFSIFILGQFFAGYPQHVIYAIFLAVVLSAIQHWKRISFLKWILRWALTGILTVGITAVAWLPFLEIFLQSTRILQTSEQAAVGSLHPLMLVKMILPYFFDNPAAGIKWGPAWSGFPNSLFYFTWIGLIGLFVLIQRHIKVNKGLLLFTFFSLLFSMGKYLPGYEFVLNAFPFFKFGRYPSMILVCTNIVLILLISSSFIHFIGKRVKSAWLLLLSFVLIIFLSAKLFLPKIFNSLWLFADSLLNSKLSMSPFHTIERDYLLLGNILDNFLLNLFILIVILYLISRKRFVQIVLIVGFDIIVNTQGMLFFAPADVFPKWDEIHNHSINQLLSNPQQRTITRNINQPYTDFGMYWEAMTVRPPFSDSFINSDELKSAEYLKQIRDSYTPDWNMAYQIPTIHGYTTLLPTDYSKIWQQTDQPRINFIDHIAIGSNQLSKWAVANYIVDKQFEIKETLPDSEPITLSSTVDLYKLPALPRFRYEDDATVDISSLKENPNLITFTVNNTTHKTLTVADRYDSNWQLTINEIDYEIVNYDGMRQFFLSSGVNEIRMEFIPVWFYRSLIISGISITAALILILCRNNKVIQ